MIRELFHNQQFLAVDKPHNTLAVPGRFPDKEGPPVLSHELARQVGQQVWPVHRLDKEVSGVCLFALTEDAHRVANTWFENRRVQKTYQALTQRMELTPGSQRTWRSLLVRGKKRAYERPFGKEAITLAQFERNISLRGNEFGLWSLSPQTGRPHQLRYELAKSEAPVIGDTLYGSLEPFSITGAIALRAVKLDFSQCAEREALGLPIHLEASDIESWYLSLTTQRT